MRDEVTDPLAMEESARADLHARINKDVAKALGLEVGETWHDLGEKVSRLQRELDEARKRLSAIDEDRSGAASQEQAWRVHAESQGLGSGPAPERQAPILRGLHRGLGDG